jgi:UDP-3-O-[3-hydroxymyristoyl] glucosamine N-acyltransferase
MADPRFYDNQGPIALGKLAEVIGATLSDGADPGFVLTDVADAKTASTGEICLAGTANYLSLVASQMAAVLMPPALQAAGEERGLLYLVHAQPAVAFAKAASIFYPAAGRGAGPRGREPIDPTARLGRNVVVEPGVVIGPDVEVGDGTYLAANAVIGRGVRIGRDCFIGPCASLTCALVGDRVTIHAGVRIGTDGFGYASSADGHRPIPHLGRVIIQDGVDIGANTCIDRGSLGDTTIGEGAKIDNMVQVAHNDTIGRRALIAAQVGLSGSVAIGDWAVLGGQAGVADHVKIGAGARVAAKSGVTKDLAGGQDYAGYPVQAAGAWRREVALLRRMTKGRKLRNE